MRLAPGPALACGLVILAFVSVFLNLHGPLRTPIVMHNGLSLTRPSDNPCALSIRDDLMLFSSRSSPTRKWTVENYGNFCNGFGENFVSIRKNGERLSPSDKLTELWGPDLSIFFVWTDDDHLAVKEGPFRPILGQLVVHGPSEFKGIHVTYSRREFGRSGPERYKAQNVTQVAIPADHVTASFDEEDFRQGKMCELSLSLNDGTIYDAVGQNVDIRAASCHDMVCRDVSSQFWVGNRIDGRYGKPLTSATVSFLPGRNDVPKGVDHRAVEGNFYENGASNLVKQLGAQQLSFQYFLNFNEDLVSYEFSTKQIRPVLDRLMSCIAGVDMNWLDRLKYSH